MLDIYQDLRQGKVKRRRNDPMWFELTVAVQRLVLNAPRRLPEGEMGLGITSLQKVGLRRTVANWPDLWPDLVLWR